MARSTPKTLWFFVLLFPFFAALADGQEKLREVDLRISGIGSGSSHSTVLAKLGKPTRRISKKDLTIEGDCLGADSTTVIFEYPGLKVVLLGDGSGKNLKVVEMRMTAGKRFASGMTLGTTEEQVTRRFGKPNSIEREGNKSTFYYVTPGNLGGVRFEFRRGRLAVVGMSEALC